MFDSRMVCGVMFASTEEAGLEDGSSDSSIDAGSNVVVSFRSISSVGNLDTCWLRRSTVVGYDDSAE